MIWEKSWPELHHRAVPKPGQQISCQANGHVNFDRRKTLDECRATGE